MVLLLQFPERGMNFGLPVRVQLVKPKLLLCFPSSTFHHFALSYFKHVFSTGTYMDLFIGLDAFEEKGSRHLKVIFLRPFYFS